MEVILNDDNTLSGYEDRYEQQTKYLINAVKKIYKQYGEFSRDDNVLHEHFAPALKYVKNEIYGIPNEHKVENNIIKAKECKLSDKIVFMVNTFINGYCRDKISSDSELPNGYNLINCKVNSEGISASDKAAVAKIRQIKSKMKNPT